MLTILTTGKLLKKKKDVSNLKIGKIEKNKVGQTSQNYPDEFQMMLFVRNVLIVEPCGLRKAIGTGGKKKVYIKKLAAVCH